MLNIEHTCLITQRKEMEALDERSYRAPPQEQGDIRIVCMLRIYAERRPDQSAEHIRDGMKRYKEAER